MASVFDVAKYILEKCGPMSTWKLQKLCYYAQAWSIVWESEPLFGEDFEAWSNGPVCPQLFHAHQGRFNINALQINGNVDELTQQQQADIDIVLKDYGSMAAYELREQTHIEDPWIIARGGLQDGEPSDKVITKEAMGEYYGSL